MDLTMRTVAELAGVSPQQASVVLGRLVDLGVVERRDVPPASLVRLAAGNLAAQTLMSLANLHTAAIDRMTELARAITPAPASLIVFGSFGRGQAGSESDVDVLVVRPPLKVNEEDVWTDSLWRWEDSARRAIGNPVNIIEVSVEEVPTLLARKGPSVWRDAAREGVVISGSALTALVEAA
jgi:predicted nucleotidyltransferase